jgi:hypothetical protein
MRKRPGYPYCISRRCKVIFIYPEDPLFRILSNRAKRLGTSFVDYEGHTYEQVAHAEDAYFKAVGVTPNPDLFDHDVDLGLYFTGNYSQD